MISPVSRSYVLCLLGPKTLTFCPFTLQYYFPHLARFDVLRPEKKRWSTATVVDVDFVGQTHRVKFHFPRTQITSDTWLEAVSNRIAPLHTHTIRHERKRQTKPLHPDPVDSEDNPKKSIENKKKKSKTSKGSKSTSLIAASASTSETGSVDDNEDEYEEVGVGMVEDYEDIGGMKRNLMKMKWNWLIQTTERRRRRRRRWPR